MSAYAVVLTEPRTVVLLEQPEQPLGREDVRIRTRYSGISSGTEMSQYRGTSPAATKRWDGERRLFVAEADRRAVTYPLTTWGYEEVGEVIEAGADAGLPVGAVVYGTWGHRSHHVAAASYARERLLPADVDPLLGIFSHIGPVALNGVLDSAVRLGETVAVFGLGTVGQITVQLLRLTGARVIGVDPILHRRQMARSLGLEVAIDADAGAVAEQIKQLTDGRGADVCIEASGSARALHEAIRACAYASKVVAMGFYQGDGLGLLLGEEFHHNRITVVCSQIGGLAPELQHRWNRQRLVQTFMRLAAAGAVRCTELITHRVPVADAAALFRLIDEQPQAVGQAVLDFGTAEGEA